MTASAATLLAVYVAALLVLAWPFGVFLAVVADDRRTPAGLLRAERAWLAWCGVDTGREMDWCTYASAAVIFGAFSTCAVDVPQRVHHGPRGAFTHRAE